MELRGGSLRIFANSASEISIQVYHKIVSNYCPDRSTSIDIIWNHEGRLPIFYFSFGNTGVKIPHCPTSAGKILAEISWECFCFSFLQNNPASIYTCISFRVVNRDTNFNNISTFQKTLIWFHLNGCSSVVNTATTTFHRGRLENFGDFLRITRRLYNVEGNFESTVFVISAGMV